MKSATFAIYSSLLYLSCNMTGIASAFLLSPGVALQLAPKMHNSRSSCNIPTRSHYQATKHSPTTMAMLSTLSEDERSICIVTEIMKMALTSSLVGLAFAGSLLSFPGLADAASRTRQIGDISASGLVFKDKLNVEAFSDPKVTGVTLYLSDFTRPVADKLLNGDIFSEPSSASMTCVRSGPMSIGADVDTSKEGEEVLKEDRSFLKSIVVRRLYDKEANNVVYVSYSSKLDAASDGNKSRFRSSLCSLHVE